MCPQCKEYERDFTASGNILPYCRRCYNKRQRKGNGVYFDWGETRLGPIYNKYKFDAKRKGREFRLSQEEFLIITKKKCFYCGADPSNEGIINSEGDKARKYSGIDRVDNNKGYTKDNCVACCKICNWMKRNLTIDEFIGHCISVSRNVIKKKLATGY